MPLIEPAETMLKLYIENVRPHLLNIQMPLRGFDKKKIADGIADNVLFPDMYTKGHLSKTFMQGIFHRTVNKALENMRRKETDNIENGSILSTASADEKQSQASDENFAGKIGKTDRKNLSGKLESPAQNLVHKKLTMHSLRYSFATNMLETGISIRYIQKIMGHNTIESTGMYTRVTIDDLGRILKTFHPREQNSGKYIKQAHVQHGDWESLDADKRSESADGKFLFDKKQAEILRS